MVTRKTHRLATAFVIGAAVCSFWSYEALAQAAPGSLSAPPTAGAPSAPVAAGPAAGCFVAPAALSAAEISAFLASPDQLLSEFPTAGLPMANRVRNLAGSSADALVALTGLVGRANPPQVAAIGAGLARAARACVGVSPLYANQIQEAVAGSPFEAAFLAASSDTQTAALGAGTAGAGGAPAGAIGGAGAGQGAVSSQGGTTGGDGGVASGEPASTTISSSRYFASSGAGSTTIVQQSQTLPSPAQ